MSKKGRRARQKRRNSLAPSQQAMEQVTSPAADAGTSAPPPPVDMAESVPLPETATPLAFEAKEPLPLPDRDDSSFPPVDLDSHFFNPSPEPEDAHERDPRMVLKLGPEAAKRRAQFQKYVKIAVGAASALCLAALVKAAVARNHAEAPAQRATATVLAPPPAPAPHPVETAPEQAAAPAEQPAVAEPQPTAPATETAAAPTTTDTAEAPAPDPKEAAKAKRASQAALERGKVGDAIEQGERSVALDSSDAEAWLILGAAYQAKGDQKNARRSFKSCLEQGKRGPKWECAQFPH